jgi:hypothetical protein
VGIAHAPPSRGTLINAPVEVWQKIFQYACVDGGRTGCALALVSHSIHDLSAETRLHSVSVIGVERLRILEYTLARLPQWHRVVRALFIAIGPNETAATDSELHRNLRAWPAASATVLKLLAPGVEVLTLHAPCLLAENAFPRGVRFPRLRDLSAGSVRHMPVLLPLPHLRRLHLYGLYRSEAVRSVIMDTPGPACIRFSGSDAARVVTKTMEELRAQRQEIPSSLEQLLVQPSQPSFGCGFAAGNWFSELRGLQACIAEHQDRQARPEMAMLHCRSDYDMERAAEDWREVVEFGRDGPWVVDTAPAAPVKPNIFDKLAEMGYL